jgi:transglutaminase-like putative cysteine protease
MVWRLAIEHHTGHDYPDIVIASYNEARITPVDTPHQQVLDHRVEVRPATSMLRYVDYWGSRVCAFEVHEPHRSLVVSGRSLVETWSSPVPDDTASWEEVHDPRIQDELCEYLAPSKHVPPDDRFSDLASKIASDCGTPRAAVAEVGAWMSDAIAYTPGVTSVSTTASEVLDLQRGVCQDFVHVALGVLRAAGIPTRYASGYLHPDRSAEVRATVEAESHAWGEAWVGEWIPFDPTNGHEVGERHVLVARGRDYGDVAPLKGVYHGSSGNEVDVRVSITRVA